jgi:hypothetical protein
MRTKGSKNKPSKGNDEIKPIDQNNVLINNEKLNSELENLKSDFNEETEKVKPERRSRKLKEEVKKEEEFKTIVGNTASVVLNIIISRSKNPVPLNNEEKQSVDLAFSRLASKYFSKFEQYGEEIGFIIAIGAVTLPRIDLSKVFDQIRIKKKPIEQKVIEIKKPDIENNNTNE